MGHGFKPIKLGQIKPNYLIWSMELKRAQQQTNHALKNSVKLGKT